MTQPDVAPLPPVAVAVPRSLLEDLAAAAGHRKVLQDPVTEIRAGRYPATPGGRTVTYRCAPDCPACAAQNILNTTHGANT